MVQGSIVLPQRKEVEVVKQGKVDPLMRICYIPTYFGWASFILILLSKYQWPRSYLLSGAPVLTFFILVGASNGYRILPFLHLWTLLATIHLVYSVAATSWLLHGTFTVTCWPGVLLTCIMQFDRAADLARRRLRSLLGQLQFISDKIALFDIPALEIDTEVSGLMVIRGLTISLSSLTVEAHGIEVGIKLTDDMELAIQCEKVKILFFRRVEVGDCFANLKGGAYEMTFGELDQQTKDQEGNPLMDTDTALLRAATFGAESLTPAPTPGVEKVKMTEYMTAGHEFEDSSPKASLQSMTQVMANDQEATAVFDRAMEKIKRTNQVERIRQKLQKADSDSYNSTDKTLRAAICSHLHDTPSVPHPPKRSIRVTTLQQLSPPWLRRFEHRLPLLLRLLLNPLAYFHPISISSITATASGSWIKSMLLSKVFYDYLDHDRDLRKIRDRIMSWLSDANFAFEMDDITGLSTVPILTEYNINCFLGIKDILVFRSLPKEINLEEVVRLGGADASFSIPSFLLPHHEHILPAVPTTQDKQEIRFEIDNADGKPQQIQAQKDLEQAEKDETNVQMSVHARLPACFDQTVLDFIAALVKATKLVEMEKEPNAMDQEVHGVKDFFSNLNNATKDGLKKAVVSGVVNDRWIAKLVGKVTKVLETAQGDVGYSGNIPVPLKPYREKGIGEGTKLLP